MDLAASYPSFYESKTILGWSKNFWACKFDQKVWDFGLIAIFSIEKAF